MGVWIGSTVSVDRNREGRTLSRSKKGRIDAQVVVNRPWGRTLQRLVAVYACPRPMRLEAGSARSSDLSRSRGDADRSDGFRHCACQRRSARIYPKVPLMMARSITPSPPQRHGADRRGGCIDDSAPRHSTLAATAPPPPTSTPAPASGAALDRGRLSRAHPAAPAPSHCVPACLDRHVGCRRCVPLKRLPQPPQLTGVTV